MSATNDREPARPAADSHGPAPSAPEQSEARRFLRLLGRSRVLAIVRGEYDVDAYGATVEALAEGGIRAVELTIEQPHALAALRELGPRFRDAVWLGAGTVRTRGEAESALAAGARYLVSPSLNASVARLAAERGVAYLPGVLTPTEVDAALAAGCAAVKLFPARHLGPSYLRAIAAPLHDAQFVPTGGIDLDNARAFLDAGALAVGIGGSLIGSPGDASGLRERARRAAELAQPHDADA